MKTFLDKRMLATAVALACLSPVSWSECTPSATVQHINDEKFDGTVIEKTSTDKCLKTEVHKDGGEFRSHTTTIQPQGGANVPGRDTSLVINEEVIRRDDKDDKGGHYGQFGGDWPDDEHTRHLPRPEMPLMFARVNQNNHSFTAMFKRDEGDRGRDIVKIKAYAEKLKARGFTIDPKESESPGGHYAYRAKNSAGYMVRVNCHAVNTHCGLALLNPETVQKREAKKTL
ncbi:MAG: hypothetical protein LBE85_09675 [Candidatus Accumulibacter sp.]|nr:hypothetical protein [Accumulibacter sp.]